MAAFLLAITRRNGLRQRLLPSTAAARPTSASSSGDLDWRPEEVQRWESGRRKLAAIMGRETENFSEEEVDEVLRYLLPTRLSARDARPLMKHPAQVFDKRKESAFDASGRPLEPAFFTGFPAYHNLIYELHQRGGQLDNLGLAIEPGQQQEEKPLKFWVKRKVMANILAEEISELQHQDLVSRLMQLASHPRASAISDFLDQFRRPHFGHSSSPGLSRTNNYGQVRSVGRRKSSVAVVHLASGEDGVTVNSEPLISYFPLAEHRQQVLFPLVLTQQLGCVAVRAHVRGGGKTGQAGAVRLAVSRALAELPGEHQSRLQEAGLLVRDPRSVERKKPGQKKARKKFAWVKR